VEEVSRMKLEDKAGSCKRERKSFRYLGIEREFLRFGVLGQDSYPHPILGLVWDSEAGEGSRRANQVEKKNA